MKKYIFFYIILLSAIFNSAFSINKQEEANILKNLRCLVCQGQSIADSNSDFAQTIKLIVKDRIEEGNNEQEIYNYLESRYGEWIIYKPSFSKKNTLLWLIPYIVFIFGGVIIFIFIRKSRNI